MSYGIVRVQKFSSGSVKGIEIHDRREKEGVSHTNKDIDWSRTDQNYDLHSAQNSSFQKAVKNRISQLHLSKAVRKDAVVMAQVLVTSDHEFFEWMPPQEIQKFFSDSYHFLADRYGAENIVSATVHLDERTPHMHFNFVPVTKDGRLSAKDILTRKSLIEQQTAFFEQVGKKYGLYRGIQGSKEKHLDTAEYKREKALESARNVEQDILYLEREKTALMASIDDLRGIVEDHNRIPYGKKAKLGQNILLKPEEYHALQAAVTLTKWENYEKREMQHKIERLEQRIQEIESRSSEKKLETENQELKAENQKLSNQVMQLICERESIYQSIDRLPSISAKQKQLTKEGILGVPLKNNNFDFER